MSRRVLVLNSLIGLLACLAAAGAPVCCAGLGARPGRRGPGRGVWSDCGQEPLQPQSLRGPGRGLGEQGAQAAPARRRGGRRDEPRLPGGPGDQAHVRLRDGRHGCRWSAAVHQRGSGRDRPSGRAGGSAAAGPGQAPPRDRRLRRRSGCHPGAGRDRHAGRGAPAGTGSPSRAAPLGVGDQYAMRVAIASWLLVTGILTGCVSTGPRAGSAPTGRDPGRPRVEVAPEPAPVPRASARTELPPETAEAPSVGRAATPEAIAPPPGPPPAAPIEASPAAARPASRQLVLNFDNADVEVVVQAAAEIVGFNYVLAPGARGRKVTVQTMGKISSDEVFAVLLTILDVNGLAAVRSGNLYRIIPREGAPQTPVRTVVGRDAAALPSSDEVLTQIVPLEFINAQEAVNLLRPFVPQQGTIAPYRETNLLIITDTAANIRRLLDMLKLVDVEVAL